MLNVKRPALLRDGLFDGNDVEAQSGSAGRYHVRNALHGQVAHLIRKFADLFGNALKQLLVVYHVFAAADNENGDEILLVPVGVVPVVLNDADLRKLLEQLPDAAFLPADPFGKLGRSVGLAHLHLQHKLRHLVGEYLIEHPIFRAALVHLGLAESNVHAVGDVLCEFYYKFSHKSTPFLHLCSGEVVTDRIALGDFFVKEE